MPKVFLLTVGLSLSLLLPFLSLAVQSKPLSIVINEIAWMGTDNSSSDEWIELYNNSDHNINVNGWILKSADKKLIINLSGIISAKNFYLMERTNDETVSNIKADLIYKGSLNNKGEKLALYDKFGNLINEVDCSSNWFAGDNKTKQTMERINPSLSGNNPKNWQTSQSPGGTPRAMNSKGAIINGRKKTKLSRIKISPVKTSSIKKIEKSKTKPLIKIFDKKETAALGKKIPKPPNNFFPLLISCVIAVFSAIVILLLKKLLNN